MKTIVLTIATCLLCSSLIQAQDENVIAYGETVRGEITLNEFESLYSFKGTAGDLIRAELSPHDSSLDWSIWHQPEVVLLDSNMNVILALHAYESTVLIHKLEETGEYHLIATSWGGRTEHNIGEFELRLEQIAFLEAGISRDCEASFQRAKYYAVRTDRDFQVSYEHLEGAFRPEVSVNVIAEDPYRCGIDTPNCSSDSKGANLHAIASLGGVWLDSGEIAVQLKPSAPDLFIVQVAKRQWDYGDTKQSARFTLEYKVSDA